MSVISGILGANATEDAASTAADTSAATSAAANATQLAMFNKSIELQEPFRQAGLDVLPGAIAAAKEGYAKLPVLVDEAFATKNGLSPAGQWQLEETQRANANALSARGLSNSGAGLELNRRNTQSIYGQDYADSWQRKIDATKMATGASPLSQAVSTANTMGSSANSAGSSMASNTTQSGINQANLQYQGGLATGNMYNTIGGTNAGLASAYLRNQGYNSTGAGLSGITGTTAEGIIGGSDAMYFFAEGGRPEPGQPYIVGENGPEVRVDDSPGTIIPNPATQERMMSKPGAGLRGGRNQPEKQDWLELEAIQSQEIKAAISMLDRHIMTEGPSLEYLDKRDKLQKMFASQVQRIEKGTEPKPSLSGGK
jgi:hypothetical protein